MVFEIVNRLAFPAIPQNDRLAGSGGKNLLKRYGVPTRRLEMTQGHSWSYDSYRIAFQLRTAKVVSWLLY